MFLRSSDRFEYSVAQGIHSTQLQWQPSASSRQGQRSLESTSSARVRDWVLASAQAPAGVRLSAATVRAVPTRHAAIDCIVRLPGRPRSWPSGDQGRDLDQYAQRHPQPCDPRQYDRGVSEPMANRSWVDSSADGEMSPSGESPISEWPSSGRPQHDGHGNHQCGQRKGRGQ